MTQSAKVRIGMKGEVSRGIDRIRDMPVLRLTSTEFEALPEYSCSLPSGIYNKRWRRLDGSHDPRCATRDQVWMIGEYKILEEHDDDTVTYQTLWYRPVIQVTAIRVKSWHELLTEEVNDLYLKEIKNRRGEPNGQVLQCFMNNLRMLVARQNCPFEERQVRHEIEPYNRNLDLHRVTVVFDTGWQPPLPAIEVLFGWPKPAN